jgi:phage terminase large subunit GpA-like protein
MKEISAFRSAVKPPSTLHPARWCAKHVHVENSEVSSTFDPDQLRWWVKPMGCFADYETRNMVCLVPPGFGKSTFYEAITCWITSENPGSVLYASQNDKDAEVWGETRLRKSLKKCEPLRNLWPQNERNAFRKDALIWPHMFMVVGGANSSNFQEKSITYGLGDEAWTWKHGLVREWLARSHNRENRKFILSSQAGIIASDDGMGQTSELHLEHDKCRKWDFAWQCPGCGNVHPFRFDQLKWDEVKREDGTLDDQATADTTRRVCPSEGCGQEFADTPAERRMLHDSYKENDGYLCTSDSGLRGYEGFHVDYGANWRVAWGVDVMQKLAADRQLALGDHTLLMQWYQKNRAIGWTDTQGAATIELRHSGYTEADYENARKIDGEAYRFGTLDAGGDHFWLAIRAWAEGGASKLLHFSYVPTDDAARKILDSYGVEPHFTFLDFGFESERMAGIAIKHGWQGVKGDGNRKNGWEWEIKAGANKGQREVRLYNKPHFEKAKNGGRAKCWTIATESLQYILQRLINGEGAEWLAYDDAPPSYAKHLNGEYLGVDRDARGREAPKWKRRGANHGRDCEIYSLAAALMFRAFLHSTEQV